jgi:hypothetical protein
MNEIKPCENCALFSKGEIEETGSKIECYRLCKECVTKHGCDIITMYEVPVRYVQQEFVFTV